MKPLDSNLTEYSLTEDEILKGAILNVEQIATYRNEIVRLTRMCTSIRHNASDPMPVILEQVALQAQIAVYETLINTHFTIVNDINNQQNSSGE